MMDQEAIEQFKTMMKRAQRDREACCDHSNAYTGTFQWNGLTYCIHCCKHNFGHKNFIEHLGDGHDTCTLCWRMVGQHIPIGHNPHLRERKSETIPKITLTKCVLLD